MGCSCSGGGKGMMARRPVRNLVQSPTEGVLRAVTSNHGATSVSAEDKALTEERRKVEKLRRDTILRALGRP